MEFLSQNEHRRVRLLKKLTDKSLICEECGCWVWRGRTSGCRVSRPTGGGYGRIVIDGVSMAVHRVAYTHFYGIIAHKKQIDHTCKNRLCWNPLHLEQVTPKQNSKRRDKVIRKECTKCGL